MEVTSSYSDNIFSNIDDVETQNPIGFSGGHTVESIAPVKVSHSTDNSCASLVPSHYDPLYPLTLTNNTFSDTLIYATLVSDKFHLPVENCIAAGIVANLAGALATSPYVSNKMMELLPNDASRDVARNVDTLVRQYIDPGYVAYYTTAWPALGVATIPEACCFILASALMRKGASLLLQSEMCKGSLQQQAEALAATDQVLQPSLRALDRVMREFAPDLVASLSRSGFSNLYAQQQGKMSAKEVLDKTLFSAAVYIVATFLYYACYRVLEQLGIRSTEMYQKAASIDEIKAQQMKRNLATFDLGSRKETQAKEVLLKDEERGAITENLTKLPAPVVRAQVQAAAKNFEFLKSQLVSLWKDPIYRSFIELTYSCRQDSDSQNAIEAFRAIDAADLLNKVVAALDSDTMKEEQIAAYKTLLAYLGVSIDSRATTPKAIQDAQEKGMDALIKMFQSHASSARQQPSSLLEAVRGSRSHRYGAIENNEV